MPPQRPASPASYAETDELTALVTEAGRCGGFYISHMRSEGDRFIEAVDELIEISRRSGTPAEIYHLKAAGRSNWGKLDAAIARIEAARARGQRITANMYTYTAGSTGLDAAMPPWVQAGGREAWIGRLKDPATRARVIAEMRDPNAGYENLYRHAGAEGTMLVGFKNPALKPLIGRTLADVAGERGVSPEDAAIDLVIEDGSRVQVVYFLMSEDNVRRQTALPWMSFGSDASAQAPEGVFLLSSTHPRAYGNFARLLGKYVREEKALSLAEAVRKLTSLPAVNLGLKERGRLMPGWRADIVVFDPKTVADRATYENLYRHAGAEGTMLVGFRNPALKPLIGRTLADVAAQRGVSPEDAAIDLVIEDGSRVQVVYFLMSEDNVRRQTALPWMSFGSDASAQAPEGVFLLSSTHPRAYGNFARLLGRYVREEKALSLAEAVRKLTSLPAANLGLKERGRLMPGWYADIVVFDPRTVADRATYEDPRQFAVGVEHVIVNGGVALRNGEPTGTLSGQVVRGRAWKGWENGGCRASAADWSW